MEYHQNKIFQINHTINIIYCKKEKKDFLHHLEYKVVKRFKYLININ